MNLLQKVKSVRRHSYRCIAGVFVIVLGVGVGVADTGSGTTQLDGETHPFGDGQAVGISGGNTTYESNLDYQTMVRGLRSSGSLNKSKRLLEDLLKHVKSSRLKTLTQDAQDLLKLHPTSKDPTENDRLLPAEKEAIERLLKGLESYKPGYLLGNVGFSSANYSNIGYVNLYLVGAECGLDGRDQNRFAFGLSGTVLPNLSAVDHSVTYRVGGDLLYGNSDSTVARLSIGQYLTPNVQDVSLDISKRLVGLPLGEGNKPSPRSLFDHLRAGDLWLDLEGRNLSSQINANIAEAGLTYGLPWKSRIPGYPDMVPSITASVTYCEQKELGLNEGGLEVRIPLRLERAGPFYLTGRYGTRGDGSIGLTFKF